MLRDKLIEKGCPKVAIADVPKIVEEYRSLGGAN
jgi:hypothetical protein